jgi:hypothetical protein
LVVLNSTITPSSRFPLRGDLLAAGLTVLWLVVVRAMFDCPWGFAPKVAPDGLQLGIPFNAGDTWSYLSWVTQYREGHLAAGLLYTTEPHPSLLWIFPLWLIGRTAALTGLPTLGVYSVMGVAGAAAAVVAFRRAARAIGLDASACGWATFAFVLGSGGSWVWHLLHRCGVAPPMNGGEFGYLDFFPSTAFMVYPYHAISYALLAALWWAVAASEALLLEERNARGPLALAGLLAFLLSVSRPYEPVAFAGAYALKGLWSWRVRSREPAAWRTTRIMLVLLGVSLAPGVAWNSYVALQPVWSTFAQRSLDLSLPRISWLSAFAGLSALGVVGLRTARMVPHLRGLLPVTATALGAAILLGFNHAPAKLASGLVVGVALLAGWGAASLVRWACARWRSATVISVGAPVLGGLLGVPSLCMGLLAIRLAPQAVVDPGLYALEQQIPSETNGHRTLVLSDTRVGAMLPGLRGLRVFAGHFSLTNDFEAKQVRLQQAGIDAEVPPINAAGVRSSLTRLLAELAPDDALLDVRCTIALGVMRELGWKVADSNSHWVWLRPRSAAR